MKAMLVDDQKRLVWSEVPDPEPKGNEILVKIHAAALNRADLLQRKGKYPSPPGCPPWMGLEISGTVVSLGQEESLETRRSGLRLARRRRICPGCGDSLEHADADSGGPFF